MKMSVLGEFGASRLILETFCILVKTEFAKNHFTLCPFKHMIYLVAAPRCCHITVDFATATSQKGFST